MTPLLLRAPQSWKLLPLLALGLLSCGGADPGEPGTATPHDPKSPEEIAGGQSGSEGGDATTPCLSADLPVVLGVVTELGGGCAAVSDIAVLNEAGVLTALDQDATLRGAYVSYFAAVPIEVGQRVLAIYLPGPMGDDSLQLAILDGEKIELLWRGILYESSFEELTSDGCRESFQARPFNEDGVITQEETQRPLSCGEEVGSSEELE